jgi:hypothetical protein
LDLTGSELGPVAGFCDDSDATRRLGCLETHELLKDVWTVLPFAYITAATNFLQQTIRVSILSFYMYFYSQNYWL